MIEVKNLSVSLEQEVLTNISLTLEPGTVHALMGPNGSGKSTFAYTLLGHPACRVTQGSILFKGEDITELTPDKRAQRGLFLALQYPPTIPGLDIFSFLKEIYTAVTKKTLSTPDFYTYLQPLLEVVGFDESYLERGVHEQFSGGEKKRLEMLQLLVLEPEVAILDELDSGLDVDSLNMVAHALQNYKKLKPSSIILFITHYQRMLASMKPDYVHVFYQGILRASGSYALAQEIEEKGYDAYRTL